MAYDVGAIIGDYQVIGIVGAGGMGQVYKVRNTISDRIEAMKILLPNLDADQELAERFIREIKVQASLDHRNIACLHTAQRVGNQLLMIMEFVDGSTLEAIMKQRRIPLRDCVNYACQVLSALSYAHARGVVHRDIKPPNMMLTPSGVVKLMDFGIAKVKVDHRLTQTGKTVGSLFYMSPEQIRGGEIDARSDLYSLGISLYEMVTGRKPFEGDSDYSIMAAHLQQMPRPPVHFDSSMPSALNDIIMISLSKDPEQRFQTADALRAALESSEKGLGVGVAAAEAAGTQLYGRNSSPPPGPPTGRMATPGEGPGTPPPLPAPSQPRLPSMPQPQYQQQYQPQYQPQYPPPARQAHRGPSHRGLYITLGSLVTIALLAAAALYVPKMFDTNASGRASATPAPAQAAPRQQPLPAQPPPGQSAPPSASQPGRDPASGSNAQPQGATRQFDPAAEMRDLRHRRMLMQARIDVVNANLRRLEQHERALGRNVNGALLAREQRLGFDMGIADRALREGNLAEARATLANAERELEQLENRFNLR